MVADNSTGNPLSAASLSRFMARSLPQHASPQLRHPWDAIALAVHSAMIAVGFRLVGYGEDHRLDQQDAENPVALSKEWNATTSHSYAFRYAHAQSSMEFQIKIHRLGGKALVNGEGVGDDKTASFEVVIKDYISEGNLPSTPSTSASSSEDAEKTIQNIFISPGRLNDLGALLKVSIIQKLAPGIHKPGYEETARTTHDDDANPQRRRPEPDRRRRDPLRDDPQPQPARPHPFDDPLAAVPNPRRPLPEPIPGFEDEFEINRRRGGLGGPARSPLNIGHDDLYPPGLGPHDPLRPTFGGGLPRPGGMGGGMHPTLDDPMFGGGGGDGGFDMQAPPGARYDPVGPGGGPRMGGGRFPGGSGGMGGRPPNPFGGFGGGDFI